VFIGNDYDFDSDDFLTVSLLWKVFGLIERVEARLLNRLHKVSSCTKVYFLDLQCVIIILPVILINEEDGKRVELIDRKNKVHATFQELDSVLEVADCASFVIELVASHVRVH
jgi:hypothetical protein